MLDIDDITFERKYIFSKPNIVFENNQDGFIFKCSTIFLNESHEYIEFTINLKNSEQLKLHNEYNFHDNQNYGQLNIQTGVRYENSHRKLVFKNYISSEGSIEFLKFEDDRIWAKFNFKAVDLHDGGTLDVKNGFLVNIKSKKL